MSQNESNAETLHSKDEPTVTVSPLSMPLQKESEDAITVKADQGSAGRSIGLGTILFAMFLFPFLFNLGSELYLLVRTAIMTQAGGAGFSSSASVSMPQKDDLRKVVETLSQIAANQEKLLAEGQRVVVIYPTQAGDFSYEVEKNKVLQLCGVDLDEPVSGTDKFVKIRSAEILSSVMASLDRILVNAAHVNLSDFHVKNAVEAKKQALKRLQEL